MKKLYQVLSNTLVAKDTYKMVLEGDTSQIKQPGQFINIKLSESYEHFLRRPISIADYDDNTITIYYKILGKGTEFLSKVSPNTSLDILSPLGNGYQLETTEKKVTLIGGGVGVPPLYRLAKELINEGIDIEVILGFRSKEDIFLARDFEMLGARVFISTDDGTYGFKGNVIELIQKYQKNIEYFYACGPERMLFGLVDKGYTGQLSFEERMGCGFGACMGCSCKTKTSYKRICKEGPVLYSNEVVTHG